MNVQKKIADFGRGNFEIISGRTHPRSQNQQIPQSQNDSL